MHPKHTKNGAETLPKTPQKNCSPRPLSPLSAKRFARRPKTFPKRLQDDPRGPGTSPRRPQDVPQEAPRRPFGGAKTVQAAPSQPPRRPKTSSKRFQYGPRGAKIPQEAPRGPQDCPETAHTAEDASKTRSRRQRLVPRRPETAQLKLHRTKSS